MIYDIACRPVDTERRKLYGEIKKHRAKKDGYRVIDIGGTLNPRKRSFLSALVDIKRPKHLPDHIRFYEGNINNPDVWLQIEADVRRHGKYDLSICTHVLEDIANPAYVCKKLPEVAESGFIAVPSKYKELSRFETQTPAYRGHLHHRWILTIRNQAVMAFPKLNFLDFDPYFDGLTNDDLARFDELTFWWQNAIDLKIVNDDYLGPTPCCVLGYYKKGLTGDDLDAGLVRQWFDGGGYLAGSVAPEPMESAAGPGTCQRETCIGLFLGLAKWAAHGFGEESGVGKMLLSLSMGIGAGKILDFGRFNGFSAVFPAFALGLNDAYATGKGLLFGQEQNAIGHGAPAKQVACVTPGKTSDTERFLANIGLSDYVRFSQTVPDALRRRQETELVIIDAGLEAARLPAIGADVAGCLKPGGFVLFYDAFPPGRPKAMANDQVLLTAAEKILAGNAYERIPLNPCDESVALFQRTGTA